MTSQLSFLFALTALLASAAPAHAVPGAGKVVGEALEWAVRKGGTEAAERASQKAAMEVAEAGVRTGVSVTAGTLAKLEGKAAGSSAKVLATFGARGASEIAEHAAAKDIPRLLMYAEKADTPATRELLLQMYKKEGSAFFERVTPGHVLACGLSVAALYGVHRATAPSAAAGKAIDKHPNMANDAALASVRSFWSLVALVVILLLWRHGQMPWHREPRVKVAQTSHTVAAAPSLSGCPAAGTKTSLS